MAFLAHNLRLESILLFVIHNQFNEGHQKNLKEVEFLFLSGRCEPTCSEFYLTYSVCQVFKLEPFYFVRPILMDLIWSLFWIC